MAVNMGAKLNAYSSYGMKLVSLFARLMFSQESHSLTNLAHMLGCSKQTVLRLIDDIRRSYGVEIEETLRQKSKYYRLKKKAPSPALQLTASELTVMQMCRAFTGHLLGPELMKAAGQAIEKSSAQLAHAGTPSNAFGVLPAGAIDYTPHQETLRTLIRAMEEGRICKVAYRAGYDGRSREFFIKPRKLFAHRDCLYLSAQPARNPGRRHRQADYDPLLAVHRIGKIELTERRFEPPAGDDFAARFNADFGVIKEEPFEVTADFRDWAAAFVSERVWSPGQKITRRKDGSIRIRFKASSEVEVISWILSFRSDGTLVKPKWLVKLLGGTLRDMLVAHGINATETKPIKS